MANKISTQSFEQIRTLFAQWHLPIFVSRDNKYRVGVILWLVALCLYLPANHFHLFSPQLLPMTWIDQDVPFLPKTVWIYTSEYIFFVVVYFVCKDFINLNKYFYSFLALQSLSVLIFWIWPTTYPRDLFPLPDDLDWATSLVFKVLREGDTPASCCPSLHVSSVYLSSFIFLDDQRKKFPFFFVWATAIAISTLTTKQHYWIDVVTGFFMAVGFYWIFHRYVHYAFPDKSENIERT